MAWEREGRLSDPESCKRNLPRRRSHALDESFLMRPGRTYPLSSGFGYAIPTRTDPDQEGTVGRLRQFEFNVCWFMCLFYQMSDIYENYGLDVIIRVTVVGNEGHDHLKILRTVATGENSLFSNNHALPMFAEFQFDDNIFGIFPKVGGEMSWAYGVGDIVEMLMQMLEAKFYFSRLASLKVKLKALTLFMT